MKFIIVGLHSSGKHLIRKYLENKDINVGRIFSNIEERDEKIYRSNEFELFDTPTVNELFENESYMFIQGLSTPDGFINSRSYEGLTTWEWDHNDVFILSPDQLTAIPNIKLLNKDICFVWVDSTVDFRTSRYLDDGSIYNFGHREVVETRDMDTFVKYLYDFGYPVLYFCNEIPERISTIIYTLHTYPDLIPTFKESFS